MLKQYFLSGFVEGCCLILLSSLPKMYIMHAYGMYCTSKLTFAEKIAASFFFFILTNYINCIILNPVVFIHTLYGIQAKFYCTFPKFCSQGSNFWSQHPVIVAELI